MAVRKLKKYLKNNIRMQEKIKQHSDCTEQNLLEENYVLLLHNDDFNTFDHVIDCLMDICKHDSIQAAQCAYIVHFKGKSDIKHGEYSELELYKEALLSRGLSVTIEKI